MKKMFFVLITSLMVLFVIWLVIIAKDNNWDTTQIRFSLKATLSHITTNVENNMQDAFEEWDKVNANIQNQWEWINTKWREIPTDENWFDLFQYIGGAFVVFGEAIVSVFEYFYAVCNMIGSIIIIIGEVIQFLFNPVTY